MQGYVITDRRWISLYVSVQRDVTLFQILNVSLSQPSHIPEARLGYPSLPPYVHQPHSVILCYHDTAVPPPCHLPDLVNSPACILTRFDLAITC